MTHIDCRSMACPLPVVTVKRAMEDPEVADIEVFLDDGAPRENVARFAKGKGWSVHQEQAETGFRLLLRRSEAAPAPAPAGEPVLLVTSDRLGDGPEELGRLLMKNFLLTLIEVENPPERIFFINTGVFLTTEGSEVAEGLRILADRGVEIFSCGVCLDFFGRKEMLVAGSVTNMLTIADSLLRGGGAVRL